MRRKWHRTMAALAVIGTAAAGLAARAQQQGRKAPPPCSSPEAKQFDFWIGEWDVTWEGGSGTNRVEKIMNGCVIEENFDGTPAMALRGRSVSTWNAKLGKWRQTWVDNRGGYLDFAGEFRDGKMILSRRAPLLGEDVMQRMVWYDIGQDSFQWNWERSDDGGKTWKVNWQISYQRRGTGRKDADRSGGTGEPGR